MLWVEGQISSSFLNVLSLGVDKQRMRYENRPALVSEDIQCDEVHLGVAVLPGLAGAHLHHLKCRMGSIEN